MAKKNSFHLHQVISWFTFAVALNVCLGFVAERFKQSSDVEEDVRISGYVKKLEFVDFQGSLIEHYK
ncbi:hypothetical protein JD844_015752 [Phrynosoma platyrhinos]|uniref:Uncharacterized protein n=1 Tax=Phrynosoma platyrhinos TaxID=52577 RepID=A0ABQ7SJF5_PHRPL|nr:hypothetical protein JD844_015752 [Phrynosoma platyrhinos]